MRIFFYGGENQDLNRRRRIFPIESSVRHLEDTWMIWHTQYLGSPPSSTEVNAWSYTTTTQYTFMAWCSVKAQEQLKDDMNRVCSIGGDIRNEYKILVRNHNGKRKVGRPMRRWRDNIRMDLGVIWSEGVDWMYLAQVGTSGGPLWTW
jgi:hypothetical protein